MKYSLDMTINQLGQDEGAIAIFDRYLPGLLEVYRQNPMAANLSLRKLLAYTGGKVSADTQEALHQALIAYVETADFTPTEKAKMAAYQQLWEDDIRHFTQKAQNTDTVHYDTFRPGRTWLDTKGERIHAHGGALFQENGVYYWYSENNKYTDGISSIWTWDIQVYRSTDLYNWEDLGLLIPPVLDNPDSNLFPDMRLDRPHIRKCRTTGKYVAWIKLSGQQACFLILQADQFLGPYTIVRENYCRWDLKPAILTMSRIPKPASLISSWMPTTRAWPASG